MEYKQPKDISERIAEITGIAMPIGDALDQWQQEKTALAEIQDTNQSLKIVRRRLLLALALAEKAIAAIEAEGTMFLPEKARAAITKFKEQADYFHKEKGDSYEYE